VTPSSDRLKELGSLSGTVILSPHADDAAFSIAGALSESLLPGPITVVTIFDRTTFVVGRGAGSLWRASRRRAREDASFCRSIRAQHIRLGMLDACVRFPNAPIDSLFDSDITEPELLSELTEQIRGLAVTHRDCMLLAPLGIGGHIDHRLTRVAAKAAQWAPLLHYADQPYTLQADLVPDPDAVLVRLSQSTQAAKLAAAAHYRSQPAADQLIDCMRSHSLGDVIEWMVTGDA
jgi:LmbE family N-acetylglucosaminyl deacetylase